MSLLSLQGIPPGTYSVQQGKMPSYHSKQPGGGYTPSHPDWVRRLLNPMIHIQNKGASSSAQLILISAPRRRLRACMPATWCRPSRSIGSLFPAPPCTPKRPLTWGFPKGVHTCQGVSPRQYLQPVDLSSFKFPPGEETPPSPLMVGGSTYRLIQISLQQGTVEAVCKTILILFFASINTAYPSPTLLQRIPHQANIDIYLPVV